jgi:hypothetical protein
MQIIKTLFIYYTKSFRNWHQLKTQLLHGSHWHNKTMIYSAADLCIEIDFRTDQPGAILQRKDKGHWHDYLVDGKPSHRSG